MSDEIKIDDGIPLPKRPGGGRIAKYPWDRLEVGQSFFVPTPPKYLASMASAAGKKRGRRFSSRTVDGGVRVWRVE